MREFIYMVRMGSRGVSCILFILTALAKLNGAGHEDTLERLLLVIIFYVFSMKD